MLEMTDKQKKGLELLNDRNKTRILMTGGARCGKTFLIIYWMIQRAYQFPGSRQLICRKALVDCRRAIWDDTLPKVLGMLLPSSEYTMQKSEMKVIFKNGSEFLFGGLDDSTALDRILGLEFLSIFCNEAVEMKFEAIQRLITRLAQRVEDNTHKFYGVNKLIADCNPTSSRSWVKKWFINRVDPTTKPPKPVKDAAKFDSMHWTPYDNPHLPPDFIEQLDALPFEMRERMLLGHWVDEQGRIFQEFDENIHVIEPFMIPVNWDKTRAIDFGFVHECAIIYTAYDYATDTIYVYNEYKQAGKTIDEIAEFMLKQERKSGDFFSCTWADHDKSDRAFLAKHDIITRAAKKSVLDGIIAIRQRLRVSSATNRPRLFIFNTCEALIEEMYSYVWKESESQITDKEQPVKIGDDAIDALRYCVYGRDRESGISF